MAPVAVAAWPTTCPAALMPTAELVGAAEGAEVGEPVRRLAVGQVGDPSCDCRAPVRASDGRRPTRSPAPRRGSLRRADRRLLPPWPTDRRPRESARASSSPLASIRRNSTLPWKTWARLAPERSTSTPNSVPRSVTTAVGVRTEKRERGERRGERDFRISDFGFRIYWMRDEGRAKWLVASRLERRVGWRFARPSTLTPDP